MAKELKRLLTVEWKKAFTGVRDLVLVDASKLSGIDTWAFRGKLAASKLEMRVLQNRVAKTALKDVGLEGIFAYLKGPTALISGGDGAASVISRTLAAWNRKGPAVAIKGGMMDGAAGGPKDVEAWASLPSREDMLSQVLGTLIAPATGIASAFHASLAQFPGLAAAHIEKKEKEPAPPAEAAAPASGPAPAEGAAAAGAAAPNS